MKAIFTIAVLLVCINCFAQQKTEKDFTLVNRSISFSNDGPSQVIHLSEADNDGFAWIKGAEFTDGAIEVDFKGRDLLQKSFVGIAFHGSDDGTCEVIYFRPFNFRSMDPVRKVHAVQYVALQNFDWLKLRQEHPGQYEKGIEPAPDPNTWVRAKIVVQGTTVSVFVNGSSSPSLTVERLINTGGKMIGYWAGDSSDGNWKNLEIKNSN